MGLLAYHPDEVGRLHLALRRALDDLRTVKCNDPAAADALRLVRSSAMQLETVWLPLAFRLLTSDPLSGRQRSAAGIGALDQSLIRVMADDHGWSVQTDPLDDDPAVVTPEEAGALGAMLNGIDPMALAQDPEQLAWLAQQLAIIGADPILSREFLAQFANWDVLPLALGTQRATLLTEGGDGGAGVAGIDGVFDGLMAIWRNELDPRLLAAGTQATVGSLLPDLQLPDPYVQALMLRALDLDPMTLATVTHQLLTDWFERKCAGDFSSIDLGPRLGPNTADILLTEVAMDPIACVRFLTLAQDNLDLLFWTLDDPTIGHDIILTATDPANVTALQAEPLVLGVIEYFRANPYETAISTDGYPGDYGTLLGALVAPWLLQFTITNDDWLADSTRRSAALQIVLNNDEAIALLAQETDRIVASFSVGGPTNRSAEIGELLGMLLTGATKAHVADEADKDHPAWDLLWGVLSGATNFLKVNPLIGIGAGLLVDQLGEQLGEMFLDQPDPDGVEAADLWRNDVVQTGVASIWLGELVAQWKAEGSLSAGHPSPPQPNLSIPCASSEWHDVLDDWLRDLPGGRNGELATAAESLVDDVISAERAGESCQQMQ